MGQNLDKAIIDLKVDAKKLVETSKHHFQVWELEEKEVNKLDSVSDWEQDYGWWRIAESQATGNRLIEYKVNGKKMLGYTGLYDPDPKDNDTESWHDFDSYQEWLSTIMNLSNDTNTVAVATSLAIDNHMSLAEFIKAYQD
jgi:hypothetical protein